jgi:hypothetical protein
MVESRAVKGIPEIVKLLVALENEATACHVVHAGKLHLWQSMKLVEYCPLPLVSLGNGYVCASRAEAQDRLERIQYASVCGPPLIDHREVVR